MPLVLADEPTADGDGVAAGEPEIDPETGMIRARGFETVKNNCTVCHSSRTFINRGYTRKVWLEQIRWMQDSQGLWEFDPETEELILDYLETNYPPR
nr:hypothetical protein [Thioalkalivibrio nitratireducens]